MLSPPTLKDLLNPAHSMDGPGDLDDHLSAPSTTVEEMYGATFDEGDDNESPPIPFVQGANLECLTCKGNLTVLRRILYLDLAKGNPLIYIWDWLMYNTCLAEGNPKRML
jgi:hypothetical protein